MIQTSSIVLPPIVLPKSCFHRQNQIRKAIGIAKCLTMNGLGAVGSESLFDFSKDTLREQPYQILQSNQREMNGIES